MAKVPLFAFANHDWHSKVWMDRHHIFNGLAQRGWPLIYTTGAQHLWQRDDLGWQRAGLFGATEAISYNNASTMVVDRPGRLWSRYPAFPAWDNYVIKRYAKRLKRLANASRTGDHIAFVCDVNYWPTIEHLDPRYVVLYVFDAWPLMPGWSPELQWQLAKLVERADLIIAVADSMARHLPGDGPERAKIVTHGVNAKFIMEGAGTPCPKDLAAIPHPRVGNIGRVSRKVDLELISAVAHRMPGTQFVFIGSAGVGFDGDRNFIDAYDACQACRNVHFLGEKRYQELAPYYHQMDVNILPIRSEGNGFWTAINPLKLHEYLASGKPVVSTSQENVLPYAGVVDIVDGVDRWVEALQRAIDDGGVASPEQRQAVALKNTWDVRLDQLEGLLAGMMAP
ncbi:MAG: glycosyltransferase [Rhodospirillaceae bacterium]|nr:glycosyltransferase [Rhodospirillaceae bacterium]MBT5457443.1 glycosyltransferase [Rhodospirillaceae bacterium]